ncbi:hypothetical protein M0805_008033 [Coniferiporia weirii]|nr:hypothetical protein M0805_008033 [Coniferiporia weirii]
MTPATLFARAPSTWSSCNAFASTSRIRLDASAFSTSAVRWRPQVTAQTQARTHYDVLGVPNTASKTEIKMEYFRLSKLYHPDANIDDPDSVAKFHVVSEAYAVLNNDDRRKAYDAKLARPPPKPKPAPGAQQKDTARTRTGVAQSKDAYLSGLRAYEQEQRRQNDAASASAYEQRRKRAPPPKRIDVKKEELKRQKLKEELKEALNKVPKNMLADVLKRVRERLQMRTEKDSVEDTLRDVREDVLKNVQKDVPKSDTKEAATEPDVDTEFTIPEHYRLLITLSAILLMWLVFVEGNIKAKSRRRQEPPQGQNDGS